MKEKISCSLDGDLVKLIDDIIEIAPYIATRSAFIEMATILISMPLLKQDLSENPEDCNQYLTMLQALFEKRCEWNAQPANENRNV